MRNLDLNGLLKLHSSTKPVAVGLVSQKPDIYYLVNTGEEKLYALLQYVVHPDLLLLLLFPRSCVHLLFSDIR